MRYQLTPEIVSIVLLAAFLHAAWNALVKSSVDRLLTIASVAIVTSLTGVVMIMIGGVPNADSWLYVGLSTLIQYGYYFFLFKAYKYGDLSQVYPIARGLAPILVTISAMFLVGEFFTIIQFIGVMITSLGILSIAFFNGGSLKHDPATLLFAVGTGVIIASYTVVDGIGVRLSGNPVGYIGWTFFLEWPVFVFAGFKRWGVLFPFLRNNWKSWGGAGSTSVCAYGLVIYAANYAPLAAVSALRETSVIMATLIGTVILGERPWQKRVIAGFVVAGGVTLII